MATSLRVTVVSLPGVAASELQPPAVAAPHPPVGLVWVVRVRCTPRANKRWDSASHVKRRFAGPSWTYQR